MRHRLIALGLDRLVSAACAASSCFSSMRASPELHEKRRAIAVERQPLLEQLARRAAKSPRRIDRSAS